MRPFQSMRYGRRTTSIDYEIVQSTKNSCNFATLSKRQYSIPSSPTEQSSDAQLSNNNNNTFQHRRNTLVPNIDLSSRRLSFQQQDTIEIPKSRANLRNFYIFFLLLFLVLFLSLVYSFIRMIKNSG